MSRLIVKNLPSGIKEERVRKLFEERGQVTECCLKYAKDGRFRKFAFIGYKLPEQATAAVSFLNKSFIDTSQIQVEICKDLCDPEKPRAWSKHSSESSAYQKMMAKNKEKQEEKSIKDKANKKEKLKKKQQNKEKRMGEMLGELKDDETFHEFLEIHKSRVNKATWSNDTVFPQEVANEGDDNGGDQEERDSDDSTDESGSASDSDSHSTHEEMVVEETKDKSASKQNMSDLEYLRSKMGSKKKLLSDAESESSESGSESSESESEDSDKISLKDTAKTTQSDRHRQKKTGDEEDSLDQPDNIEDSGSVVKFIIKMRGIPANAKEKQVGDFFRPLKIKNVKIPRNAKGKKSFSTASVEFYTEKDQDQGMGRNKNFMGSKRIYLHKVKVKETVATTEVKPKPWEIKLAQHKGDGEEEGIAESGRLYVRNLAYCCTEEDIEEHFGKFGPLTEVHVPIDRFTKKMKGFAFVTFMMPEHAVKAYTQLDGSVFQGRMLHILPGRTKKEEGDAEGQEKSSFKKKKEAKDKAAASSSHNWNALFLGANAVADAMADKYRTTKSAILDAESGQSLGVRMALGETQLVAETREFLLENGVQLDSFSQPAAARSKTVILVKNLPAGTTGEEIEKVFNRYGTVGRVVLPPSGITAIVEYLEPSEARNGFQNLAYSKFQHVPLYLEWAPVGVFKPAPAAIDDEKEPEDKTRKEKHQENDTDSESEDEAEPDTTLFVKNLNFDTTEESLTELFKKAGDLVCVTISKKKDMKNSGQLLSMGYGFVQFKKRESAQKAMRQMQNCTLDGHQLILKVSNRATVSQPSHERRKKQDTKKKPKSSKILIRNVPFEAKVNEIRQLFGTFGELKSVRLPKKLSGTGPHRGFGFVDFLTTNDAKRAFNALCHSTHLYGRRLVLEWADNEETVDQLRQKTASHFHEDPAPKRLKKSALLEDLKAMTE